MTWIEIAWVTFGLICAAPPFFFAADMFGADAWPEGLFQIVMGTVILFIALLPVMVRS